MKLMLVEKRETEIERKTQMPLGRHVQVKYCCIYCSCTAPICSLLMCVCMCVGFTRSVGVGAQQRVLAFYLP